MCAQECHCNVPVYMLEWGRGREDFEIPIMHPIIALGTTIFDVHMQIQ